MKYFNLNTFVPPSDVPPISFGVWISIKFYSIKNSLNNCEIPDYTLKIAYLAGVLKSITLLSSLVFNITWIYYFSFFSDFSSYYYNSYLDSVPSSKSVILLDASSI